jgi:hypothetical protein
LKSAGYPQASQSLSRYARKTPISYPNLPVIGLVNASYHVKQRTLARSIWSNDGANLTGSDREIDVGKRLDSTERQGNRLEPQSQ